MFWGFVLLIGIVVLLVAGPPLAKKVVKLLHKQAKDEEVEENAFVEDMIKKYPNVTETEIRKFYRKYH